MFGIDYRKLSLQIIWIQNKEQNLNFSEKKKLNFIFYLVFFRLWWHDSKNSTKRFRGILSNQWSFKNILVNQFRYLFVFLYWNTMWIAHNSVKHRSLFPINCCSICSLGIKKKLNFQTIQKFLMIFEKQIKMKNPFSNELEHIHYSELCSVAFWDESLPTVSSPLHSGLNKPPSLVLINSCNTLRKLIHC